MNCPGHHGKSPAQQLAVLFHPPSRLIVFCHAIDKRIMMTRRPDPSTLLRLLLAVKHGLGELIKFQFQMQRDTGVCQTAIFLSKPWRSAGQASAVAANQPTICAQPFQQRRMKMTHPDTFTGEFIAGSSLNRRILSNLELFAMLLCCLFQHVQCSNGPATQTGSPPPRRSKTEWCATRMPPPRR